VNIIYNRIASLADNTLCQQMDPPRWAEFKKFFKLKDGEGEDPEKLLKIPGLSRALFPHQLYACWWMFITERGPTGGGYNADYMGMGKVSNHTQMCSTHPNSRYSIELDAYSQC